MNFFKSGKGVGLVLIATALSCGCADKPPPAATAAPSPPPAVPATSPAVPIPKPAPATDRLLGRWLRPDGGYVLEIKAATPAGLLDAAYFNPRPIHVSKAAWKAEPANGFGVFIELTDQGYPGATYRLRYSPGSDRMNGTYTQPAANQTYDVEFTRLPADPRP